MTLDDFNLIKLLGEGAQAKVYLVKLKENGKQYAMKVIRKDHILQEDMLKNIIEEKRLLNENSHPFLVHMEYGFQNDERLFFVMDYI